MTAEQRSKMRARILDAARARFLEEGLEGLSMRSIASRVGVSSMTLYLYYESRQDIVRHIVLEGFTQLNECLGRVVLLGSLEEKLNKLARAYFGFVVDNERYYAAMHRYFTDVDERRNDPLLAAPVGQVLTLLTEVISTGHLPPDASRLQAASLWSSLHGLSMLYIGGQFDSADLDGSDVLAVFCKTFAT